MKTWVWVAIIVVIILGFLYFNTNGEVEDLDGFAQCLSDSGAKMYGAYWCSHCKTQKAMFGDSWDNVNYIECSLPNNQGQTQECIDAGITGYPTWESGDGSRKSGEVSLSELGNIVGC